MSITVRAAAKINLHLGVGRAREDGFHPLDTVYQAIGIHDDLTLSAADGLSLSTHVADHIDPAAVPPGRGQHRAPRRPAARRARRPRGHGCVRGPQGHPGRRGHGRRVRRRRRCPGRVRPAVGPAHLRRRPARPGRTARQRHPVLPRGGYGAGCRPRRGRRRRSTTRPPGGGSPSRRPRACRPRRSTATSTPCTPTLPRRPRRPSRCSRRWRRGEPLRLARALHNDLQEPAIDLRPELGDLIARGEAEGALRGLVSGSGPTVVFLCDSADGASETAAGLAGAGHDVVLTATGPVAGAHVLA